MNWFINFLKKALQLITGKPKTTQTKANPESTNSGGNPQNPSKPEAVKPTPPITPTSVVKPAPIITPPPAIKQDPKITTSTTVKPAPISPQPIAVKPLPKNSVPAQDKQVVRENTLKVETKPDILPPAKPKPVSTAQKEVDQPVSSTQSKNVQQGIRVSGNPFKTSITGPINESLLSVRLQVNYEPATKYKQSIPQYFPLVLMPERNTVIKPPVNGKTSNKGMTEESFCRDFLMKYFPKDVFDSLTVFHGSTPYEPDLAFIDLTTGKNIFIDIEIDEPYDGVTRNPTHYRTSTGSIDDNRNQGFTERGWIVIRFAEEQILSSPNGCVKFIGEVIKSVNPLYFSPCLDLPNSVVRMPIWNDTDARNFAKENKREKYLGISVFFQSAGPRDYSIKDTQLGKEIEGNLSIKANPALAAARSTATILTSPPVVLSTPPKSPTPFTLEPAKPYTPSTPLVNKPVILVPPPIVSKPSTEEPRVTTKTDNPSQPSPRPYAYE